MRRWKTRQCRSVQSIIGATEKRKSYDFVVFSVISYTYGDFWIFHFSSFSAYFPPFVAYGTAAQYQNLSCSTGSGASYNGNSHTTQAKRRLDRIPGTGPYQARWQDRSSRRSHVRSETGRMPGSKSARRNWPSRARSSVSQRPTLP